MNQQASKTIGLTLLLAAGLLSILIAITLSSSSPPGVGAHDCNLGPTPSHQDSRGWIAVLMNTATLITKPPGRSTQ